MKKMKEKIDLSALSQKALVLSMSAILTGMMTTGVVRASDIDVYQTARSGDITLMFMLDISGSMDSYDGGSTTRIERVKTAMTDLLSGNATKGITRISDEKIIGLSTLGVKTSRSYVDTGAVLIPARRLDATVGSVTQRQVLLDAISGLTAYTWTPTARSYAETAAYLMGQTTASRFRSVSDMPYYRTYTSSNKNYIENCTTWNSDYSSCSKWSTATQSVPVSDSVTVSSGNCGLWNSYTNKVCYNYTGMITIANNNTGFPYSADNTKNADKTLYAAPSSLVQTDEVKKCSGQGIYVLTDGEPTHDTDSLPLMQGALGEKGTSFTCTTTGTADATNSYDCLNQMSQSLLDPALNPAGLKFKTAVVGFGSSFNNVASYDSNKTQEQNIAALGTINTNVKRAAYWGIIGQGGWYSGNSSADVVKSVNDFINNLGSDIPSVTTGTPTIPNDELNPSVLQKYAYYPQFQPTPAKSFQLWLGNLKKYNVNNSGRLTDASSQLIVDNKGALITERVDLWAPAFNEAVADNDINTTGSKLNRFMGGVKSKLNLRADANNNTNRKLLTNRVVSGTNFVASNNSLTAVTLDYLNTASTDDKRGYLMALLGYDVDPTTTAGMALITKANLIGTAKPAELRQVGAVMHSAPVLLTSQGKITYDNSTNVLGSTLRSDYVLFGTTQGLLQVVDAATGVEKFAFVPNEMIENQKEAFLKPDVASNGLGKMFYGVDGQWAVYSEYVLNSSGQMTVGTGLNSEKGKQRVYGGLRMGGRGYYGLNLDNIDSPQLMFNINPDAAAANTPLSFMGQSWSKPAIGWVKWGKTKRLVMFVGGGYDAGGDDGNAKTGATKGTYAGYEGDAYNQGTNGRGAGVYMFDATTGELLWWSSSKATTSSSTTNNGVIGLNDANMKYSVVSEIKTVDRDADGLIDHLYFGDLGGQVFRVDLNNKAAALGAFAQSHRILNLSRTDGKAPRFYEAPAFSIYDTAGKTFAVVSIGSGNRSKPLQEYTVGTTGRDYDSIYNIYDKDVTKSDLYSLASDKFETIDVDLNTTTGLKPILDSNRFGIAVNSMLAPYSTAGWYYQFKSNLLQSEKVFSTPIVINNDMYVSTFDGSKPGLSGDCGAGVKGESLITKFCMPYGQCTQTGSASDYKLNLGAGITGGAIGAGENGTTRLIVANVDTSSTTSGSAITGARYNTGMNLVTQRWYEKYK